MKDPELGIFKEPDEQYRAAPGVNISILKELRISPHRCKWALDHGFKESKALRLGSAFHAMVLEPEVFKEKYLAVERRTAKVKEQNPNSILLPRGEWDAIHQMYESFKKNEIAAEILSGGQTEMAAYAKDERTGLLLKGKIDHLNIGGTGAVVTDLKTASDFEMFRQNIGKHGTHLQAAWYSMLVKMCTGKDVKAFYFIVVEKCEPYEVFVCEMPTDAIHIGHQENRLLLDRFSQHFESDDWPHASSDGVLMLDIKPWHLEGYNDAKVRR